MAEAVQFHAAANDDVILAAANSLRQSFVNIVGGDDDHHVAGPRAQLFQGDVEAQLRGGHLVVEAPAVDGVDDVGNAGTSCRQPPQHTRLRTVRVHNIVVPLAHHAAQLEERARVVAEADLAHQVGQDGEGHAA